MARQHVNHSDIVRFAEERVNLPRDKAGEYRAQVWRLRDKLEGYLGDHPDFSLKKMLLSGSLAKGTALRSLNDIDVACYVSGPDAPTNIAALLEYLATKLRTAFPNFSPDQVKPQTYSVTVSFRGSGLDVDVVPILYKGDPQWYGNLVSQEDGSLLETSIPLHLQFTRKRKAASEVHFAQIVRLVKFWIKNIKREHEDFRFKSFMVEMILSHLCDNGVDFSDYPEALQQFFTYIARTGLRERIVFTDYYKTSQVGSFSERIQIMDPVNAANNVARLYNDQQAEKMVDAALDAGDAIDAALAAPTKQETVYYCRRSSDLRFRYEGDTTVSSSFSISESTTFTLTHAKHMGAKVSADLKRMQRLYVGGPSDADIAKYEAEIIEYLKAGYLGTVTYGFRRNGDWIEPTIKYTARDLAGGAANDDDPGKVRPGADIAGASFYSYLTYSVAWDKKTEAEKASFKSKLPFQRGGAPEPGIRGYLSTDRTYSSGGRALERASVRSY